jgi:hypothetical protein
VLFTGVFFNALAAEKKNPAVGTWKLDVAKSKYSTGSSRTVEEQGDGEKTSYEEVGGDGSQATYGYTATYDDKGSPISGSGRPSWRKT